MSYLSIKSLETSYISYHNTSRVIHINYKHPLYTTYGITLYMSDISITSDDKWIRLHIHSDRTRGVLQKLDAYLKGSYPLLYDLVVNGSLYIPLNTATDAFANRSITRGYVTLKYLKETRDKHYKAIFHFHLK